jgi:hypothetical protein
VQRSAKKSKKDAHQAKESMKSDAEKPAAVRSDEADSSRTRVSRHDDDED